MAKTCMQRLSAKANGKQNIVWPHVELISAVGATKISSVAWALSLSGDQLCALRSGFSFGVACFYGNTWQKPYVSWHRLFRQAWRKGALLALHSYVGSSVCANNFLHGHVSHRLRALIGTVNAKSHTPNSWQAWRSRHGLLASLACKYRASYERHRKRVCGKQRNRKTHSLSSSHHWTSVQLHCNSVTKAGETHLPHQYHSGFLLLAHNCKCKTTRVCIGVQLRADTNRPDFSAKLSPPNMVPMTTARR